MEEGQSLPTAPPRATREVLNDLAGLRFIEKHVAKKPITQKDVLKLHTIMAKGVMDQGEAGRYRGIQVYVGR